MNFFFVALGIIAWVGVAWHSTDPIVGALLTLWCLWAIVLVLRAEIRYMIHLGEKE